MNPNPFACSEIAQQAVGQAGLVAERYGQFAVSAKLELAIEANLRGLGYGG